MRRTRIAPGRLTVAPTSATLALRLPRRRGTGYGERPACGREIRRAITAAAAGPDGPSVAVAVCDELAGQGGR